MIGHTDSPVFNKQAKSFAWAAHCLAREDRNKVARLYDICRLIDDIADNALCKTEAIARLELIEQKLDSLQSPYAWLVDYPSSVNYLKQLMIGCKRDILHQQPKTMAELIEYCYLVAGTVGLLICDMLHVTDESALSHAVSLGIAMQLTNIVRDIKEDHERGRCYIPGMQITSLENVTSHVQCIVELADSYYRHGWCGLHYLPQRWQITVMVASHLYRAIGHRVERHPDLACRQRLHINTMMKTVYTIKAFCHWCISKLMRYYMRKSYDLTNQMKQPGE